MCLVVNNLITMIGLLLALFDEALQRLAAVCSCCFPSKTYRDRCQHGRLARPVAAVVPQVRITLVIKRY